MIPEGFPSHTICAVLSGESDDACDSGGPLAQFKVDDPHPHFLQLGILIFYGKQKMNLKDDLFHIK